MVRLTRELPKHKMVPTIPLKAFLSIIGGLDNLLIRTNLMQKTFKSIAIPLNKRVLANNITEKYVSLIYKETGIDNSLNVRKISI